MPTMTCSDSRRFTRVLVAWIDAVLEGNEARARRSRREAARLARILAADPVLGPALARHLPGGVPTNEEEAVACILAVMKADETARAAAANN